MSAFGISFPKLTLRRTSTSKNNANNVSSKNSTIGTRTFSLSIKNVPSQSYHYDIPTTVKTKPTSSTTILAIDGETKQFPKTLSVFNELQLDDDKKSADINERRKSGDNANDVVVSSSLSSMGSTDCRSSIRFLNNIDSKKILYNAQDKEQNSIQEHRSNHTFTSPTSSLSSQSSSNDLRLTMSSISIELPKFKYAIEKFLIDNDDNPIYQIAEEFSSNYSPCYQDHKEYVQTTNEILSNLEHCRQNQIELHTIPEKNTNNQVRSQSSSRSTHLKWYVSELRINRPLIYRTQWTNGQQQGNDRKLSYSVNDLKQIYNCSENVIYKDTVNKTNNVACSNLSLHSLNNQVKHSYHHQSDDNMLLNNRFSCTNNHLINLHNDEDDQHLPPLIIQRKFSRSFNKNDTLITNESVKKKLFDILNDDELENACLEGMSKEFEKLSHTDHHYDNNLPIPNSLSSFNDILNSSPTNQLQLTMSSLPPLSSSYDENLSSNINNTTERFFGRSRLITTSLDKISTNHNLCDYSLSSYRLRPSYENARPSWYTSPLPQWHTDDQLSIVTKDSSNKDNNLKTIDTIDPNRLFRTKAIRHSIKENKYVEKYNHHNQKELNPVDYSLLNTSTSLVDDSTTILPISQDKSSNLLMFI